ncbi:MAG: glycosyltransferase [Candidatus Omnitrophota bacterium]
MKITLIILTLNEIKGMRIIMPQIKKEWVDQLIILDGGSTDGTVEFSKQNGYFVYIQKKRGIRNAFTEVMPFITGEAIITFSPDGNSLPELIPVLAKKIKQGYDMVIASRYAPGAKSFDDDPVTAFGNWFFTKTVNLLHGGAYTDSMVLLRAYRTNLIYDLELQKDDAYTLVEKLFKTRIGWEPLLSVRAAKRKLRIAEVPGDEPPRIGGERKLQVIRWGAAFYLQFIREVFFWR